MSENSKTTKDTTTKGATTEDTTLEGTTTDMLDERQLLAILISIKKGDFSVRMPIEKTGIAGKIADTLNNIIESNEEFAKEIKRSAKVVGQEGKLKQRLKIEGRSTWADCTNSINGLITDLVQPTSEIAGVISAVAKGDLTQTMTLDIEGRPLTGEFLRTANIINTMVDQLGTFASEVTRVAREVGTEGSLGGQAEVEGVSGTWRELTENVNLLAGNLTSQVRNIAEVTTAVANGELSRKITVDAKGEILELKNTINIMVDQLSTFASEVTRVAREVGTEGKLGGQAEVRDVSGTWRELTENVNMLAGNLTSQVRNIADVTTAVANGDLSRKITVDAKGEILELKNTMNIMVDQLSTFASEVTRVAREVGTEGKLGGQAEVRDVSGTWRELTENVNTMATNLTSQVRGIAGVVTSVANGNLRKKLLIEAKGEVATLTETINDMIDTLAMFAEQVTTVARDVGVEGKLGGQANVPGASGTWRDLTDNVNRLAQNLTVQVRAISNVATSVTKGDFSRTVVVEAEGEVEILRNTINEMIQNLKETTLVNERQDWLNTNIAKFGRLLQGQRDIKEICNTVLSELALLVSMQHGVIYIADVVDGKLEAKLYTSYGYQERKNISSQFVEGQGLIGQCLVEKQRISITNVPADYVKISSGLGEGTPMNIVVLPVLYEGGILAVIELASFQPFTDIHLPFFDQLTETVGIVINTIRATIRTEELLQQSQSLTEELQKQQEELQQTNEELEEKAELLVEQNSEVERKNKEVELARMGLEEKAEQLALTSKYKSEFLANMSHELRTPLNSMLILTQQMAENSEGNLSKNQVKYANTIHESGKELLSLINDILDLSKVESGTVDLEFEDVLFTDVKNSTERTFTNIARSKKLDFGIELEPTLPNSIYTDQKRLEQVLKNLLSNAFKFTEKGSVEMKISTPSKGWSIDNKNLNNANKVIAFSVIDTGIGIPEEKQKIIFEAFQQADGSTSRKYEGTGLGLAISREIAVLLGGEIQIASKIGKGSTFTLYLPINFKPSFGEKSRHNTSNTASIETSAPNMQRNIAETIPLGKNKTLRLEESEIGDDIKNISPEDTVVLIVEDDIKFAYILLELVRKKGFKGIIVTNGYAAIDMAQKIKPSAITLDIKLPDIDGWAVLDSIKKDISTRHIPVHIISIEEERLKGLQRGAVTYLKKPADKEALEEELEKMRGFLEQSARDLLIVCENKEQREKVISLIGNGDVNTKSAATGEQALDMLKQHRFDCVVLDVKLPDMDCFNIVNEIQKTPGLSDIPIVLYPTSDITKEEEAQIHELAHRAVIKEVRTPEQLLNETALFLHRIIERLPESKKKILKKISKENDVLFSKKVLIVDDDVRNIFAITSLIERYQMDVLSAEDGKTAVEILKKTPDIQVVLMDIMMPEMDGYETMQKIRKIPRFKSLPIIALTAKAMKGDREKCISAGASDYIAKPVDGNQLISLLRVWLY